MYIEQGYKGTIGMWKYWIIPVLFMSFMGLNYVATLLSPISVEDSMQQLIDQLGSTIVLIILLVPLAIGLFVVLGWTKLIHAQSITSLTTSRPKIDWKRILFSFSLWAVITIIMTVGLVYISPDDFIFNFKMKPFLILAAIGILLIPLQTSFEEYLFRGHMMQGIGLMAKNRWVPLVITSVLFGLMHIANPEVEKLGYGIMIYYIGTGFFLGIMTLMDEGLELALGFHAANNLVGALLVTADWTAFQTDSIYRDVSDPKLGWDVLVPVLVVFPILLYIFSKKYNWSDWKERLTGKVLDKNVFLAENTDAVNHYKVHPGFKLNGNSYSIAELKEVAFRLSRSEATHERHIGNFLTAWLNDKPTILVQTSGSTGRPNKILLQKQHMVNSAIATADFFDLQQSTTALLCLPAEYIAGKMMLVRAMVMGWHLDYAAPSSMPLAGVSRPYDFSAMVPLQLENSLDKIDTIRTVIVGGASVSPFLVKQLKSKSSHIFETYGMTETITHIAVKKINSKAETEHGRSPFEALPNISLSKDDRDCLVINAPEIADELVITNDLVELISETKFHWLGRYDNIINSGGVKLIPEQIENKLRPALTVPFFVAGLVDDKLGQKLVLVIEGESNTEKLTKSIAAIDTLTKFEVPKAIYQMPSFSYTKTGKINRKNSLALLEK